MIPYQKILAEAPVSLRKRLALIVALARHTTQDHRAAAANARSGPTIRETEPELAALWQWLILKYSADQPRVPAGSRDGGQWTSGDGGGSGAPVASTHPADSLVRPAANRPVQLASLETGTMTDASPAPIGRRVFATLSGTQFAADPSRYQIEPSAHTGIDKIDNATEKLLNILVDTSDQVGLIVGTPQNYGITIHWAFAAEVMIAGIRGISPLDVERSFNLPPGYPSNRKSVRPDVVLRNDAGDIIAIYDVKTGSDRMDPWREDQLRAATGADPSVPVIILHLH